MPNHTTTQTPTRATNVSQQRKPQAASTSKVLGRVVRSTTWSQWQKVSNPVAQVSRFLKDGIVTDHRDLCVLIAAMYPCDAPNDDNMLFVSDEGKQKAALAAIDIDRCIQVFERMAACHEAGLIRGWLDQALAGPVCDGYDMGIVALSIARCCGIVPQNWRWLYVYQDLLAKTPIQRLTVLEHLRGDARLLANGFITSDADTNVTHRYIELDKRWIGHMMGDSQQTTHHDILRSRRTQRTEGRFQTRQPRVTFDHLVLNQAIAQQLQTAITQASHSKRLFDDWGLGEMIPYGRGTTMLFTGPPGVGKTASAEAVASALGKQILDVKFTNVQSKHVSECEKAICAAFAAAKENDAVLFWDEIDALVCDREAGEARPWVTSQVITFLRELEAFEGVCVLATNRHHGLDTAIDRRLAFRIIFPRPCLEQRQALWQRMLPASLPLAEVIDVTAYAEHDLSGAEIKNVVLAAARLAVSRGNQATVTKADFDLALAWEFAGRRGDTPALPQQPAPSPAAKQTTKPTRGDQAPAPLAMAPSLCVNTRPVSEASRIALAMTGVAAPFAVLDQWAGRRFITRNGSLVQLTITPAGKNKGDVMALDVIAGGHGHSGVRGHKRGSIYVVDDALCISSDDDSPPLSGMDVIAEVVED